MERDHRPDPDALLASLQKQEARQARGKLKIFLGMSAGVGKTYAMLEAAHGQVKTGVRLLVGVVETHRRAETESLLQGLEVLPRARLEYRGHYLEEMDLDGLLARHPPLALVDELAHTNAPGARHPKRYQDVVELLDAGIDVYTTLNVQHLASRADTVFQITGIQVHETVPDSVVDLAEEIELIDLTPEELRQRLAEGKVYFPASAEVAANNFFRVGNLTALREMALRLTAERVDHQLQDYMSMKRIAGPWKSGDRLMVAIPASPFAERLVRWTRRMAYNLRAAWLAVYVETTKPLSDEEKAQVTRNLALVRELGGEVVTTAGENVVGALLRVAHERNVSQIIVGKPTRPALQELLRGGSRVDRLIRESGDLDVYVITGEASEVRRGRRPGDVYVRMARATLTSPTRSAWHEYAVALAIVAAVVALNLWTVQYIGHQAAGLVLLFTISVMAVFLGRGPVLVAATFSAVVWTLLFLPPILTPSAAGIETTMLFVLYFAIALATGSLTTRLRAQELAVRDRERRTIALTALAHSIASARTLDAVLASAVDQIGHVFDAQVAFLLGREGDRAASEPHRTSTFKPDEKEMTVAAWAFNHRRPAGRFTDTLPSASARWLPLITPNGVVGVMGLQTRNELTEDQQALLETVASQVAVAVERETLAEAAQRAAVVAKSEQLYRSLLESVSREIQGPIATMEQAASRLSVVPATGQPADDPGDQIRRAADRLHHLVENLMEMTRLQSGALKPQLSPCDVGDLINGTLARLQPYLAPHEVIVEVAPDLPRVNVDKALMEQVLHNLIHNSATHTPPGTRVRVSAKVDGASVVIAVADRGPGLPAEALPRVFDRYFRAADGERSGVGLGLSITRGLVEAQGGTIAAENRTRGGISFIIRLPIGERRPEPAKV